MSYDNSKVACGMHRIHVVGCKDCKETNDYVLKKEKQKQLINKFKKHIAKNIKKVYKIYVKEFPESSIEEFWREISEDLKERVCD